jgi:hypothetical protein
MSDSVRDALVADLELMPVEVRRSARAVLALKMAEAVDARPTAIMAKELAAVIDRLGELAPPKQATDEMDDLEAKRAKRRA